VRGERQEANGSLFLGKSLITPVWADRCQAFGIFLVALLGQAKVLLWTDKFSIINLTGLAKVTG